MLEMKFKSRGLAYSSDKAKIYFCCHHNDFDKYFDVITDSIFSAFDCNVFYCDSQQYADELFEFEFDLMRMQLFVVPVTKNLLCTSSRAIDEEISIALKHNIPIIPIILESGLEELLYNKLKRSHFVCINWNKELGVAILIEQFKKIFTYIFSSTKVEGNWIFLSHSSADIEKVRMVRNAFESHRQNPLAFHLKCLKTDTKHGREELEGLIKREIDSRDWFVFCESDAAKASPYVNMEKNYIINSGKKKIWSIDMSLSPEELMKKVEDICTIKRVYLSYRKQNRKLVGLLTKELLELDFEVGYNEFLIVGESFREEIEQQIHKVASSGFFVAIISEGDENSFIVQRELPFAIETGAKVIVISIGDIKVIETYFDSRKVKHYNLPQLPNIDDIVLIAELIEAETRIQINGPICQADAYNTIAKIEEKLNYKHRYHSQEAILDHVTNSSNSYLETYRFPCCGKTVTVGNGPVSRFRVDGCFCDNE